MRSTETQRRLERDLQAVQRRRELIEADCRRELNKSGGHPDFAPLLADARIMGEQFVEREARWKLEALESACRAGRLTGAEAAKLDLLKARFHDELRALRR